MMIMAYGNSWVFTIFPKEIGDGYLGVFFDNWRVLILYHEFAWEIITTYFQ